MCFVMCRHTKNHQRLSGKEDLDSSAILGIYNSLLVNNMLCVYIYEYATVSAHLWVGEKGRVVLCYSWLIVMLYALTFDTQF